MQFDRNSAIGRDGQLFALQYISQEFGWIGRLFDNPDIGIDIQIEILDRNRNSTGKLLAAQIKSTEKSLIGQSHISLFIDARHIEYWMNYSVPVLIFAVSLKDAKIWWQQIIPQAVQPTSAGNYAVYFDTGTQLLTRASALSLDRISMGPLAPALDFIGEISPEVREYWVERRQIDENNNLKYDIISFENWCGAFESWDQRVRESILIINNSRLASAETREWANHIAHRFSQCLRETRHIAEYNQFPGDFYLSEDFDQTY